MKNVLQKAARLLTLIIVMTQTQFVHAQSLADLTGTVLMKRRSTSRGNSGLTTEGGQ
jgi:hypothetical protein